MKPIGWSVGLGEQGGKVGEGDSEINTRIVTKRDSSAALHRI